MLVGGVFSVASGAALPSMMVVMGDMMNTLTENEINHTTTINA